MAAQQEEEEVWESEGGMEEEGAGVDSEGGAGEVAEEGLDVEEEEQQSDEQASEGQEDSVRRALMREFPGLVSDLTTFVLQHGTKFHSGREVARVFHGKHTAAFPVAEWGRDRAWGRHKTVPFCQLHDAAKDVYQRFQARQARKPSASTSTSSASSSSAPTIVRATVADPFTKQRKAVRHGGSSAMTRTSKRKPQSFQGQRF